MLQKVMAEQMAGTMAGEIMRPSLTESLSSERARLARRITEIDEVLSALREQPSVERIIDLIFKQGIR